MNLTSYHQPSAISHRPSSRRCAAFTLIELLTVITIIGILAGLIIGASKYAVTKSRRSTTLARMTTMETALEDYKADNGTYPTPSPAGTGSSVLYNRLSGASGGKKYFTFTPLEISKGKIFDSFGNEYQYVYVSNATPTAPHNMVTFDLWSAGPDGKTATTADQADDITNWQTN